MERTNLRKFKINRPGESYLAILEWFFDHPLTPITLSQLAKKTKVSKKTATNVVSELVKENFLIKEEVGRAWRIYCNQKHYYNYTKKISYNLSMIYTILYPGNLLGKIQKNIGNSKSIILFGSYRKGENIETSDIDLAVELSGNQEYKILPIGNLKQFGFERDVIINLHVFSRKNINSNLFSNISNGIVLEGFLETT